MGKYFAVIKAAECGSLTRAAQALGYTQPSLGYIINNIEDDLGVKIFYRDQRGLTLTEVGAQMLEVMQRLEATDLQLHQIAQASKGALVRVGIFPSVASQWLPDILVAFYQDHPGVQVRLEHQIYYLDGELGVKQHRMDCAFFTGECPPGLDMVPLYTEPYYLVVATDHPLAGRREVSLQDLDQAGHFLPTNESFDEGNPQREFFQQLNRNLLLDFRPQENRATLAMVERGLGITVLPPLILADLVSPSLAIRCIPLVDSPSRTVSLLSPREQERSALASAFLACTQQCVAQWKANQDQLFQRLAPFLP